MGAAQAAALDFEEELKIAVDQDDVWSSLKNPQMAAILCNGYVQLVKNQGKKTAPFGVDNIQRWRKPDI